MYEIVFRGKREGNGDWVNGSFIPDHCEVYYGDKLNGSIKPFGKPKEVRLIVEVDRKTVDHYTGLTDKNGTKILEDILEGDLENNLDPGAKWRSVVVWGRIRMELQRRSCEPANIDELDIKEGEVIGNINDNPELMEVNNV